MPSGQDIQSALRRFVLRWRDYTGSERSEAQTLLARRQEICRDRQIGLTTLYNDIDEGAHNDLAALHRQLDEAVVACYRWPKGVAQDDVALVERLLELNGEIVAGDRSYDPFGER